jgi:hypothetical protein
MATVAPSGGHVARRARRAWPGVVVGAAVALFAMVPQAHAARVACSESGDVCLGTYVESGSRFLEARYMARYLLRDTICVRAPTGRRACRERRLTRLPSGGWRIRVRWSREMLDEGPGIYRVSRRSGPPAVTFRVRAAGVDPMATAITPIEPRGGDQEGATVRSPARRAAALWRSS